MIAGLGHPHRSPLVGLALAVVAAVAAPPAASAAPDDPAYCADAEEAAFLDILNAYRAENALEPLALSRSLSEAAEFHSADMASTGYFDHTMSDGTSVEQNIRFHGYTGGTYGENIAAGTDTAESAFRTWQASATHNQNMLQPAYGAVGIGRVQDGGAGLGWYWTTIFGGEFDEPAAVCSEGSRGARTIDDVNLRRGPGPGFEVKRAVPAGIEFPIVGEAVDGYLPIEDDGETVWAALEFLSVDGTGPASTAVADGAEVLESAVSVTQTVDLRVEPDREAAVVAMIPTGDEVELTGEETGEFVGATWEGASGWIDAAYVSRAGVSSLPQSADGTELAGVTATSIDALNLRSEPSREGAVLTVVPTGTDLLLTGNRTDGYFEVRFGDLLAWADAAYLRS
ncbi:MAG TPA: SH3 domain-containing protein [Thermomicrobiales bacterium]|nr:SH3 domain-containing protein [Thermomicrobiales bacterium]